MVSHLFFYQLVLVALVWLCLMLHWAWPSDPAAVCPTALEPTPPLPKRSREPPLFAGLIHKPHCDACEHAPTPRPQAPAAPPPRIVPTRGRRRQVDTSTHFCPNPDCAYRGWVGWGNLRANGHPNGGPWRQLLCVACRRYFLETLGTLFHGKRASVELIVRVIGCLAEGVGIRGTARVFEVDPNTVLQWLVEAAEQLQAFSQHVLHDVRARQVQLDELFALLSAVKAGEVSEADAIECLERSPQGVWVAMGPESKLLLAIDVGDRTLAMAQRVVHQVAQVLAPDVCPAVSHRWVSGVSDGLADPLWAVGPAASSASQRAKPEAALDAAAAAALRASGEDGTASAPGRRAAPCGVWLPGGHQSRAGPPGVADQYRLCGAAQPHHPAACRRGRAPGQHAVQGRRRVAAAVGSLPLLRQFLFAPRERTPAPAPARAHPRDRLSHAVAALHSCDGCGPDRSGVGPERGVA